MFFKPDLLGTNVVLGREAESGAAPFSSHSAVVVVVIVNGPQTYLNHGATSKFGANEFGEIEFLKRFPPPPTMLKCHRHDLDFMRMSFGEGCCYKTLHVPVCLGP